MNSDINNLDNEENIVIAIIPARGKSKRLQRKNLKELNGLPLIAYSISNAKNVDNISHVYVSTEDEEISNVSSKYGADVITRPEILAQDTSSSIEVVLHAIHYLEREKKIFSDIVILLQPTSPLRTDDDLRESLKVFIDKKCESLISVSENPHPPYWSFKIVGEKLTPVMGADYLNKRSQDLPLTYFPNGAIFISKTSALKDNNTFYSNNMYPYIMPFEKSVDIDTIEDFNLAQAYLISKNEGSYPSD